MADAVDCRHCYGEEGRILMLTLPADIATHKDDVIYIAAHLIELQGGTPHYFTDFSADLIWNGHTWLHASPFVPSAIVTDAAGVQDVSVTFDEQAQIIQAYDQNEGMSDRKIFIHEAWIDPTTNPPTVYANGVMQNIAGGTTAGLDFDETGSASTGTLLLGSASAMTSQNGPRNSYDLSCQNGYKDARCKYAWPLSVVLAGIASGSRTVTPASGMPSGVIALILIGTTLYAANADGTNTETVTVTAITGTTFTATFATAKSANWTVAFTPAALATCDRTYSSSNGCQAHFNTPNFRGCRHALTPPATVTWGGQSSVLTNRTFPQDSGVP